MAEAVAELDPVTRTAELEELRQIVELYHDTHTPTLRGSFRPELLVAPLELGRRDEWSALLDVELQDLRELAARRLGRALSAEEQLQLADTLRADGFVRALEAIPSPESPTAQPQPVSGGGLPAAADGLESAPLPVCRLSILAAAEGGALDTVEDILSCNGDGPFWGTR